MYFFSHKNPKKVPEGLYQSCMNSSQLGVLNKRTDMGYM